MNQHKQKYTINEHKLTIINTYRRNRMLISEIQTATNGMSTRYSRPPLPPPKSKEKKSISNKPLLKYFF